LDIGHSATVPRILFIIPTLDRGGAEKQLTLLACGLKTRGWDVHVVCLKHGGPWREPLDAAKVPVTVLGWRWKHDPPAYFRLRRFITELKPDIVQTWRCAGNTFGRAAAISAGVEHIVATEQHLEGSKRWPQGLIDRYLARRTKRIVTSSTGVISYYTDRGAPPEKLVKLPMGVAPFQPGEWLERADLLSELGLPPNARLVGAVGRLVPQKRYKDMVWAMDLLRCLHDDLHLVIVGDGPQRWRLERYGRQVSVVGAVHFFGERSDVPALLPHFSCFWLASSDEGHSNSLLEAMAAGLPVVASDTLANRDLIVDGESGFLVKLGDRAGFAGRTNELLTHPELAQKLGSAAKQRAEQHFSVEQMVDAHESLYRSLLDS
jgi:glycosyltransferase involved in cell wall biosynthesis